MKAATDILFVSATLEVGGSETKIVKIANALSRSGYSAAIAYLNPPDSLLERIDPGVPVTYLQRRGKFSINSLRRLRNLVAGGYRIVVSVNYYPLLYVIPTVKYLSSTNCKAVCLINTTDFGDGQRDWGHIYAPFLRRCDQLIYGCEAQQALWTQKYKLPVARSMHIYNGVDCEYFSPDASFKSADAFRREFGIPKEAIVIGSVGRFAPEKNFELLIKVLTNMRATGRNVYAILVGEGAERAALASVAARSGLSDKLLFPGVLNDIRPAVAAMDIFIMPSYSETFSNAALEAMAMARPVILGKVGGALEMVEHGKSGFLFDVRNVDTLTDLLVNLHDSKQLRDRIGIAARQRVTDRFYFGAMLDEYKVLIDAPFDADGLVRQTK